MYGRLTQTQAVVTGMYMQGFMQDFSLWQGILQSHNKPFSPHENDEVMTMKQMTTQTDYYIFSLKDYKLKSVDFKEIQYIFKHLQQSKDMYIYILYDH